MLPHPEYFNTVTGLGCTRPAGPCKGTVSIGREVSSLREQKTAHSPAALRGNHGHLRELELEHLFVNGLEQRELRQGEPLENSRRQEADKGTAAA